MRGLGIRTQQVGFGESIEAEARKLNRRGIVVKVRASDFTQPLGRMSAKANEFTKSLEASNARVIAFGASAAIIGGVTTAFAQLVIQAAKVEKIMTDINVVLGATSQNLNKFGDGLFKVARSTSQSLETAAEAALEFSRQGLTMEETLRRTNDALILTRLTSMKAADAVKGLTAAVNGFGDAGLNTTQIINKLAAVDVQFAVGTDDLINALARAGAVAQDAGVSFDQLMGAVTAAQQITARGGAVIGNSFKTIFTRVQRSSTIQRLEELGIAVRNVQGNALPAMQVLENLANTYEKLGGATRAAVAEQVGGVFQINILKAAIKDLNQETSIFARATEASSMATNQAQMKNLELQKTLSSISAQTLTTVRELTANLGDLTIAPALKEFLTSANGILGTFNELFGSKEGESIGGDFAKGFARALGSVLMGPGVMVTVLVFAKLFAQAFKFAKDSIKDLLQITSIKDKERMIQESIVDAMMQNVDLSKRLVQLDGDQAKQESIVLEMLKQQTRQLEQQRKIAKDISPSLRRAGVQPNLIVGDKPRRSQGLVPNYSEASPIEKEKERAGARKGGYVAGAVSTMNIPKMGEVVYNKNETVKRFSGMQQPAIMPPEKSKAGKEYRNKFSGVHGFDPYQGSKNNSTYSSGLIPNFARQVGSTLEMNPAKLIFNAGPHGNKAQRQDIEAALKDPTKLMYFTAALDQIVGYDKNNKLKAGSRITNPLSVLQHELGIKHIKRGFSMQKKPRLRGNQKDVAAATEQKVANMQSQNQKHAGVPASLRARRTGYRDRKGKKFGHDNYPIDVISYGANFPSIEVKSGEFHPSNIISKSLRMASDRELGDFIRSNTSRSDIADSLDQANFKSATNVAKSLDLFDPVSNSKVKNRDFDINDPRDREFIDMWGLSAGLIPNFVNRKAIQELARRGKGGEKANAQKMLSKFSIKSKSMFDDMIIDDFLINPNMPYKGSWGNTVTDYLLSKGYDRKKILSAAKKPSAYARAAEGLIPNFVTSREFAKLSGSVARWSARNNPEPKLKLIGPDKLFTIPRRNADEANKTVQNIRQFISSMEYRSLNAPLLKKKLSRFYNRMAARSSLDNPDRSFTRHHDPSFEGRIAASSGLVPSFAEELENKQREKEIFESHRDGSKNRKYFGGLIPNFAFKNSPIRLDGGFGRKGRIIQDEDTGSYMTYVKDGPNVRDIDFLQSNKKGDAYKMFKGELEGKFMKGGGTYTSGSLKQQRSFKQNSSSNFEDLLYAFPQLRYRMQGGALTSGRLINEALGSSHKFSSIRDLQGYANRINRKDFQNALGTQAIGNRILITDLSTSLDGSKNRKYFRGLIPSFAEELENKQREKEIFESHRDGSKNRKYFRGLIPSFAEELENKQREKEIFESHRDGSKNRKYFGGLIPNFVDDFVVQALPPHSGFYNKGSFVQNKSKADRMSRSKAVQVSNILLQNRKIKSKIFQMKGDSLMGDSGIFDRQKPGRHFGLIPNFVDNFLVKALSPHSGFYNKGQFVQDQKMAERMSRSKAVQVSNILLQNRKIKSQIMQSVGDNLMGDSGIFDRQKPGRSHGFVPNFLDKSDLPNVITIGSGDTIDGRNVYKLKDGRLFKPVKSGKQKPLSTVNLNDFISGQVMTNSGIKDAKIRYSTLAASTLGKRSDFRKFTTDPGRSYEDKLTPYMGKAHPNLQIDYGQKSGIRFTNKAKFGSGTDSFMKRWKYADAYMGLTHGIGTIFRKLKDAGLMGNILTQVKQSVGSNKNLNLSRALKFAEISGSASSDTSIKSKRKTLDPRSIPGYSDLIKMTEGNSGRLNRFLGNSRDKVNQPKLGIEWDVDAFHVNSGFVPNFADPLGEAIQREKNALGMQGSSAKIYVDQDNRLKNHRNPDGLMVANTRDEPVSGSQGVNRALGRGLDPKTHGASIGFTPNYVMGIAGTTGYSQGARGTGPRLKGPAANFDGVEKLNQSASNAASNVQDHGESSKGAALGGIDVMGAMFALTSVTYAVEGAMGDVESTAAKAVKTLNATVMGFSQGAMVFQAMSQMGDSFNAKGTKMGSFLGKAAKGLGVFGAAIGVAVPVFNALKENTTLLDGPLDSLRKSAAKTSKSIESLGNAITAHQSVEETRKELTDLNNSASKNTFDGEIKRLSLHSQLIKAETELSNQTAELSKHVNLSAAEIELMTSGTAAGFKKLQEAMVDAQRSMAFNKMFEDFTTFTQGDDSILKANRDKAKNPLMAQQVETSMAKMTAFGMSAQDMDKAQITAAFDGLMSVVEAQVNKYDLDVRARRPDATASDRAAFVSRAMHMSEEEKENRSFYHRGTEKTAEKAITDRLVSDTSMPQELKTMAGVGMESMNPTQLLKFLEKQKELVLKFNQGEEEKLANQTIDYAYMRETTKLREALALKMELLTNDLDISLRLQKESQGVDRAARDERLKFKSALGSMTKAAEVQALMANKEADLAEDFANQRQAINNKYTAEGTKYIQSLFKDQTGTDSLITPDLLQTKSGDEKISDEEVFTQSQRQLGKKLASAFPDHLKSEGEEVQKGFEDFTRAVSKATFKNPERLNYEFEKFLHSLGDSEAQQRVLITLQKKGVISEQKDIESFFNKISALRQQELGSTQASEIIAKAGLQTQKEVLDAEKGTLAHHKKRLLNLQNTPHHLLDKVFSEQFQTNSTIASTEKILLRAKQDYISHGQGLAELQEEQLGIEANRIINEHIGVSIQSERLEAERKLRQSMSEYNEIIAKKVSNEITTFDNKQEDDVTLLKEQKKQDFFQAETAFNDGQSIRDEERARLKHIEALNQGSYYLQALHGMSEAARNFDKALIQAKAKLNNNEFAKEGLREMELNQINMRGGVQKAMAQRDAYVSAGNAPRAAEMNTQVQQQMKDLNKELNQGSLFLDSWRVKLAEAHERIANFSETLANTSFDAVRDGFRQMFDDIVDGSKSTGDIALNFFGSIAKKIQDKLFDQAADQLTAGIFEAFGLKQYHTGGFVDRYSKGGTTREVPAMLTSGEYVVRKKIVDKIGVNELNRINQTGSLEELYEKPNEDNFELFDGGGMVAPPIIRLKDGGNLRNYLSPKDDQQQSMIFPEDMRSSIDGLSDVIERFAGGMVYLNHGGRPHGRKYSGVQSDKDRAYANIGAGAGMMAGTALGKMAFGKDPKDEGGPTAPTRPQQLNTRSALNIDPTGRQMSARFRREDQYSKDYGKYLLDKYQYDVDRRNEKQMQRAQQIGAIATTATMMAGMAIGKKITEGPAPTADDLEAKVKRDSPGFQKITRGDHNLNQYQREAQSKTPLAGNYYTNVTSSQSQAFQEYQKNQSSNVVGGFSKSYSYNSMVGAYSRGGQVYSNSYFNQGGSVYSPYSYFYNGGRVNSNSNAYHSMTRMSEGGMVHGPGGIDKVGPVMLDRGEYVIKASSVNKVEKQYPGFFDRLNSIKMNEGGSVAEAASKVTNTENTTNEDNSSSSNVTVNINVSSGGETTAEGGGQSQQDFAYKIKDAVIGVIANEKRVGGMLRGY